MSTGVPAADGLRVLIAAPTARDGQVTAGILASERVTAVVCPDLAQLARELEAGAGALLLTEETFNAPGLRLVLDALALQEPWSDIPIVMLMRGGVDAPAAASVLPALRNVTLLDRPATVRSVVSAVKAALRARARQYEIRDQMEAIREADARLRESEARRERLLESERAARSELERASRMKDEFLATLSHELRTPLNAILGWSELIRSKGDQATLEHGLAVIERNARVQVQLIEDLLDMSRIVSGKLRLNLGPVEPPSFVEAAIQTVEPAARVKGIDLRTVYRGVTGPIQADADRLQQVVWNLLSNAVKFTPDGGWVEVLLEQTDAHVSVAVSDSGPGIEAEFLPFLFQRFRQADASTTRTHRGLGLGLAIVRHLVELHGGSVTATSGGRAGGATFTLRLPTAQAPAEPDAEEAPERTASAEAEAPTAGVSLAGLKVLVVDDEPDARDLIERVLHGGGAIVLSAGSAAEAIPLVERERPDILVSDIGMPGTDGYTFLREVRSLGADRNGDLPAVALTAFARPEDRTQALEAGYLLHITKPVEPRDLLATVARAASARSSGTP